MKRTSDQGRKRPTGGCPSSSTSATLRQQRHQFSIADAEKELAERMKPYHQKMMELREETSSAVSAVLNKIAEFEKKLERRPRGRATTQNKQESQSHANDDIAPQDTEILPGQAKDKPKDEAEAPKPEEVNELPAPPKVAKEDLGEGTSRKPSERKTKVNAPQKEVPFWAREMYLPIAVYGQARGDIPGGDVFGVIRKPTAEEIFVKKPK